MTFIWFVIWLIANNVGTSEPLRLDPVTDCFPACGQSAGPVRATPDADRHAADETSR
jgi:hypothetical protein